MNVCEHSFMLLQYFLSNIVVHSPGGMNFTDSGIYIRLLTTM